MKKIITLISILISCSCCYSQTTTLKILGQHSYTEYSKSQGAIITLEENPNKCDPVLGFISLEEQLKHLSEAIEVKGSKSKLIPIKDHTYSAYRKQTFRFEEPNLELFDEIMTICNYQNAIIKKRYYKLPAHDFIGEDEKAIAALRDAKQKAEIIANHLNYKVVKVLNVDDNTTGASRIFDLINKDRSPEEVKKIIDLFQSLNSMESKDESNNSTRSGQYHLWVTFEISSK